MTQMHHVLANMYYTRNVVKLPSMVETSAQSFQMTTDPAQCTHVRHEVAIVLVFW